MNTTPLQESFSAGELSPRLYMRSDISGYQEGCRELLNFIAQSRGPARSRDGFRYLGRVEAFPGVSVIATTARLQVTTPAVDVQVG